MIFFVAIRYGIGWYLSSTTNHMLSGVGTALSGGALAPIAWVVLGACWLAALFSFMVHRKRKQLLEMQTGLGSLRGMSWREFEMLVGEAFRRQRYRVEETGLGGADGGIDLLLRKDGKTTLVQCKQWRNHRVDVKIVREMYGLLNHHAADAVKIVSVGEYTKDARRFAQGKPIELVSGDELLTLVGNVQTTQTPDPADAPEPAPTSASAPDCPKCGAEMLKRENRSTKQPFWGCPNYPKCRGTRPA